MNYGSVCSGIEAATVAWHSLGWKPKWFSEIENFPSQVLTHHYPDVPNLGDMTKIRERIASGEVFAPDILVGGTPCQAFSVAGARRSLDDDRGQLTLEYVRLANEIDAARLVRGLKPSIVVWENVPGVLNTKDNAFGCFLGALSGEECELQPSGKKWTNAGCVFGPQRTVAWRVLDAQYFGVAQRRRRVFVVASAREGFNPAEVLFEFDSVRRDIAPSRSTGQEATRSTSDSPYLASGKPAIGTLMANAGTKLWLGNQEAFSGDYAIIHPQAVRSTQDPIIQDNRVYCGTQNDACRDVGLDIAPTLRAGNGGGAVNPVVNEPVTYGIPGNWIGRKPENGGNAVEPMNNISPCQTKTDRHAVAYAFDSLSSNSMKSPNPNSGCREVDLAKTLDTTDPNPSKNQGGIGILQSQAFGIQGSMIGRSDTAGPQGSGVSDDVSFTLTKGDRHAVGVLGGLHPNAAVDQDISPTITQAAGMGGGHVPVFNQVSMVRRLTPTECERLQGFPDSYTKIPYRNKKADDCPDGPRYAALGNSMAVPVMKWIGERIREVVEGES